MLPNGTFQLLASQKSIKKIQYTAKYENLAMNSGLREESDIGSGFFSLPKSDSKISLGTKCDKFNKCLNPILISKKVTFRTAKGNSMYWTFYPYESLCWLSVLNACGYATCFKQRSLRNYFTLTIILKSFKTIWYEEIEFQY